MKKFTYVLILASLILGLLAVSPVSAKQGVLRLVEVRDTTVKQSLVIIFQVNKGIMHERHPHSGFFIKRIQYPMFCEYKKLTGNVVVCIVPKKLLGKGGQEATILINNQVFQVMVPHLRHTTR